MTLSVTIATLAMVAAVVLGTAASLAVHRYRFFGRDIVSFALVLPIALPGIITGIALNAAFRGIGLGLGTLTIVIGHATFCVVVVYNNVIARLRRSSPSLEEASADLGADQLQTFRYVTLPGHPRRPCWRARCWRSRSRSTRSSSPTSWRARRRRSRSGSSTTSTRPTSGRSSTSWPSS